MRRTIDRLSLHQIDSVNVLVRAHYLPAFSRLGSYDRTLLDRGAWGHKSRRRLFEYWAHEASLLPLELHPLFRWRMARAERGEIGWAHVRAVAHEHRDVAAGILRRIEAEGPLAASDFDKGRSRPGWWEWGETKRALEWLFWSGQVTTATRRGSFERVYDLTERVISPAILALRTPSEQDAQRMLVERAARALGVATEPEMRDYFRLSPAESKVAVSALVEEGVLLPVQVEGWRGLAFAHGDAVRRRRIEARALLAPFDPLIWERGRTERLFGFRYRIEIYTPAAKRTHGYYVLPFLLGDKLVGRVDLKADRQAGRLLVQATHFEPQAPIDVREQLTFALEEMASWLSLPEVRYSGR